MMSALSCDKSKLASTTRSCGKITAAITKWELDLGVRARWPASSIKAQSLFCGGLLTI